MKWRPQPRRSPSSPFWLLRSVTTQEAQGGRMRSRFRGAKVSGSRSFRKQRFRLRRFDRRDRRNRNSECPAVGCQRLTQGNVAVLLRCAPDAPRPAVQELGPVSTFSRCGTQCRPKSERCLWYFHSRGSRSIPVAAAARIFPGGRAQSRLRRRRRMQTRWTRW